MGGDILSNVRHGNSFIYVELHPRQDRLKRRKMSEDTSTTEADLEARISATLRRVFPDYVDLSHQRRFRVRVGHREFDVGGRGYVDGRADILVHDHDIAIAVLELKKEGLALTADDEAQGWSYAALARAPLVVVTNGADTRILLTQDCSLLEETSLNAAELARRLRTAAELAQVEVNGAIDRLLGTDLAAEAIDKLNAFELGDKTGGWGGLGCFVEGFLVTRSATNQVLGLLHEPSPRAIVVSGAPLSGKSSVLRELVQMPRTDGGHSLYIDGSECSEGLFRRIANVLASLFSWAASPDDARRWLSCLASDPTRPLFLCVDSPEGTRTVHAELDEILTGSLGGLRLVLALDEAEIDSWIFKPNRRERTRLGRHSNVVTVDLYSNSEFDSARRALAELGGGFVHGAAFAPELRAPWVLRAAAAPRMEHLPAGKTVVLPPTLGLEALEIADEHFACLGELRDFLERVAHLYLEQAEAEKREELKLAGLYDYCISRDWLKSRMESSEIFALARAGLLHARKDAHAGTLYYVRVPILFAKLLASRLHMLVSRMVDRGKSADECATWLVARCSTLPLGDLIGAEVVRQFALNVGDSFGICLINGLLGLPPVKQTLSAGSRWVTVLPEVGVLDLELDDKRNLIVQPRHGRRPALRVPVGAEELIAIANLDPWLMLSQTGLFELAFTDGDGELMNVAGWLLMQLGTCPVVLRRPSKHLEGYHVHEIGDSEIPCFGMGIVEPVTWEIVELLSNNVTGIDRDGWVQEAVHSGSLPLLGRVTNALRHLKQVEGLSAWADRLLDDHCEAVWKEYSFHE
jgi:hypothetical protein